MGGFSHKPAFTIAFFARLGERGWGKEWGKREEGGEGEGETERKTVMSTKDKGRQKPR